jgi:endogenous inhibitor of DNA gyrase (YacG/DUF329 family)
MNVDRSNGIEVICPACAGRSIFGPSNRWRPFCSERCKRIDLGAWASDQYRIAGSDATSMEQDAGPDGDRSSPH